MQELEDISIEDIQSELARRSLAGFVEYTYPTYRFNWHHKYLCSVLDEFIAGKIQKLMVFMPPQHGKSELTTRRMPAKILGDRPDTRIAIASYSSTFAKSFNMDIQRIIDSDEYNNIYPDTVLSGSKVVDSESGWLRNSQTFEIVNHKGSCKFTGVEGGSLTGNPVDVFILDDPYSSREDALSNATNESVWSFYINVARMRMHNKTQELVVLTRWHEDDVAARLLREEKDWTVISFPAIKDKEHAGNKNDPRKIGDALWPEHLNVEKLLHIKRISPVTFDASYQQNPRAPKDVLVYTNWVKVDSIPPDLQRFYAGDFGFSHDPTCVLEMAFKRPRLYVRELIYKPGLTNGMIIKELERQGINIKKRFIWDSSEPKSIKELQLLGMNAIGAVKGPGSVELGINEIREGLIICVVSPSPNVEFELNSYQFHTIGGRPTNEPMDKNNHAMDTMRYGYTNRLLNGIIKV